MKTNPIRRTFTVRTLAAMLVLGTVSCTEEPATEPAQNDAPETTTGQYVCFEAGTPAAENSPAALSPETRAGYDSSTGYSYWQTGDCLSLFVKNENYRNQNLRFTQKAGSLSADGRTTEYEGSFEEPVSGIQTVYAIYPHDPDAGLDATTLTTNLPERQIYSPKGYTGIPLVGKYEGDIADLHFKFVNPFAVVELRLASMTPVKVTRILFQGNNGEKVSGRITVNMQNERPEVHVEDLSTCIQLDCGDGVELTQTPKSFYIVIPALEYTKGYRFDIRTDREGANSVVLKAKSGGIRPAANTIYGAPARTLAEADFKHIIPDALFRAWLSSNGWVSVTDDPSGTVTILNTTDVEMICSYQDISSLEGIEYFPQLTRLICGYNNLALLDVSKNRSLLLLDCYAGGLTELDLSHNTSLTTLLCGYNRLTELDLSANTSLTSLHCWSNELTKLDLTNNTLLTSLKCQDNHLTELDATKMADPAHYELYCGQQKDANRGAIDLRLKLKQAQQTQWNALLTAEENQNVTPTFEP